MRETQQQEKVFGLSKEGVDEKTRSKFRKENRDDSAAKNIVQMKYLPYKAMVA